MTPERWRRIDDLFDAALRLDPAERRGLAPRRLRRTTTTCGPRSVASWPRTSGRTGTGS